MWLTWRAAMHAALYGPGGFYARGEVPAHHFRTSVHASPGYAGAVLALLRHVDAALGHPRQLDLVDVGAGRGELLGQVLAAARAEPGLTARIAAWAVEIVPRPAGLDPAIRWCDTPPTAACGLMIASEWLDNIPLEAVELTLAGPRLVLVDPVTGAERAGAPPGPADRAWADAWWPLRDLGDRAEIGRPRCEAWAGVVRCLDRGLAAAADYGHQLPHRPATGTLAGYRDGRAVAPVPDGSCDLTAHVALDACAAAGRAAGAAQTLLATQRQVLRALGVGGRLPAVALASQEPVGYVQALCRACVDAELLDPHGLGGFGWLLQTVNMTLPEPLAGLARWEAARPEAGW